MEEQTTDPVPPDQIMEETTESVAVDTESKQDDENSQEAAYIPGESEERNKSELSEKCKDRCIAPKKKLNKQYPMKVDETCIKMQCYGVVRVPFDPFDSSNPLDSHNPPDPNKPSSLNEFQMIF
ncbi:hypothetical protein NL676_038783 [Syzygium grande]|nr:hypothetical protein NL676_038783 [Syzygium grande]